MFTKTEVNIRWKPEKEQSLPGADDDEAAYLSRKFFLWTIPQRDRK